MTWMSDNDHGVCGHIYEIIDYYLLLYTKFNVGILICEDWDWSVFENCIVTKYSLETSLIEKIKNNTIFCNKPKYLVAKNSSIFFVDGGLYRSLYKNGVILNFKNIFTFRCSPLDTHFNLPYKNLVLLQDSRVYADADSSISIDYKKKINFKFYKDINRSKTQTAMLYLTTNCRHLCNVSLLDILFTYKFERYILVTNAPQTYEGVIKDFPNIKILTAPVENLFEKFDAYIYTPTGRDRSIANISFDCSPRFIVECAHYDKQVIYHGIDDDYLSIDTGLKWRRHDIENDFQSLYLDDSDELIDILYDRLT